MNKKWKSAICTFIKWFFLICMASFALIPLLQVVFNSFRSDQEVKAMPIGLPQKATLANYFDTWTIGEYGVAYLNTLLVAGVVITVVLTVVGLGAYALSKLDFRLKGFMTAYFFVHCTGLFAVEQAGPGEYQSGVDDRLHSYADTF